MGHHLLIYLFRGIVEYVAHHAGIYAVIRVLLYPHATHTGQIELHLAVQIAVDGRGTERTRRCVDPEVVPLVQQSQYLPILRYLVQGRQHAFLRCLQPQITDRKIGLCLQLAQEAAHLVPYIAGGVLVINACDMLCTLNKAVEVIGEHRHAMAYGGKAEANSQRKGYHGIVHAALGQEALAHVQHQYVAEVQASGLQDAHHLQALCRLTVEWDAAGAQHTSEQAPQRGRLHVERVFGIGHYIEELAQCLVHKVYAFEHQDIIKVAVLLGFLGQSRNGSVQIFHQVRGNRRVYSSVPQRIVQMGGIRMHGHSLQERQSEAPPLLVPSVGLQGYQGHDETEDGRAGQCIAHGDVHVPWGACLAFVIRYGMKHGLELVLVT